MADTKNIMIVGVGGQGTLLTSRILGGILYANFKQTFRCEFSQLIHKAFENSHFFRIITRGAEGTNNHKIVLVARDGNGEFSDRSRNLCCFRI